MISGDLRKAIAAIQQSLQHFGQVLVARRLNELPLGVERADRFDTGLFCQHLRRQGRNREHDVAWLVVTTSIERLLNQSGVADLEVVLGTEHGIAFPTAQAAWRRCRNRHQAVELVAKRIFVPGDGVEKTGIVLQHGAGVVILRGALLAPDPFEDAPDGVFVKSLDGVFGGIADADDVDHGLDVGQGLAGHWRHGAVDGAEAAPESKNMSEIVEMAFAGAIEKTAEILEGVDDVPFGEGEERIVLLAPVALLVDRGQGRGRRRGSRSTRSRPAGALNIGQRRQHRQRDHDRDDSQDAQQAFKHGRGPASAAPARSRSGSPCRRGRDAGHWRKRVSSAAGRGYH